MTTKEPISHTIHLIFVHYVGIIDMGKTYSRTKTEHLITSCPVAQSYRHAIRILLVKDLNVLRILLHIRAKSLLVIFIHIGNRIESRLHACCQVAIQIIPYSLQESLPIMFLACRRIELHVGASRTTATTGIAISLSVASALNLFRFLQQSL